MRTEAALASILLLALPPAIAQEGEAADEILWTCPTHREETGVEGGVCPQCGEPLVRSRSRLAWSCPRHAIVAEPGPGTCPICGSPLYPVSKEIAYVCPMHPEVVAPDAGSCPICRMELVLTSRTRPHQDHNPKHGGIFFMAADAWHHLEGVYPEEGTFRVYLFDNYSRPLSARSFRGRAVLKESFDPETRELRELVWYPLRPSRDGAYLEAQVGAGPLPREITARIQLEKDGTFERFDFVFPSLSSEASPGEPAPAPGSSALVVPETAEAIAAAILERRNRVKSLLDRGALEEIYVPAIEAKDLAVALEARPAGVSDPASLSWALKELVRSAWLLDDYADLGNRAKVESAYVPFDEAARTIASLHGVVH